MSLPDDGRSHFKDIIIDDIDTSCSSAVQQQWDAIFNPRYDDDDPAVVSPSRKQEKSPEVKSSMKRNKPKAEKKKNTSADVAATERSSSRIASLATPEEAAIAVPEVSRSRTPDQHSSKELDDGHNSAPVSCSPTKEPKAPAYPRSGPIRSRIAPLSKSSRPTEVKKNDKVRYNHEAERKKRQEVYLKQQAQQNLTKNQQDRAITKNDQLAYKYLAKSQSQCINSAFQQQSKRQDKQIFLTYREARDSIIALGLTTPPPVDCNRRQYDPVPSAFTSLNPNDYLLPDGLLCDVCYVEEANVYCCTCACTICSQCLSNIDCINLAHELQPYRSEKIDLPQKSLQEDNLSLDPPTKFYTLAQAQANGLWLSSDQNPHFGPKMRSLIDHKLSLPETQQLYETLCRQLQLQELPKFLQHELHQVNIREFSSTTIAQLLSAATNVDASAFLDSEINGLQFLELEENDLFEKFDLKKSLPRQRCYDLILALRKIDEWNTKHLEKVLTLRSKLGTSVELPSPREKRPKKVKKRQKSTKSTEFSFATRSRVNLSTKSATQTLSKKLIKTEKKVRSRDPSVLERQESKASPTKPKKSLSPPKWQFKPNSFTHAANISATAPVPAKTKSIQEEYIELREKQNPIPNDTLLDEVKREWEQVVDAIPNNLEEQTKAFENVNIRSPIYNRIHTSSSKTSEVDAVVSQVEEASRKISHLQETLPELRHRVINTDEVRFQHQADFLQSQVRNLLEQEEALSIMPRSDLSTTTRVQELTSLTDSTYLRYNELKRQVHEAEKQKNTSMHKHDPTDPACKDSSKTKTWVFQMPSPEKGKDKKDFVLPGPGEYNVDVGFKPTTDAKRPKSALRPKSAAKRRQTQVHQKPKDTTLHRETSNEVKKKSPWQQLRAKQDMEDTEPKLPEKLFDPSSIIGDSALSSIPANMPFSAKDLSKLSLSESRKIIAKMQERQQRYREIGQQMFEYKQNQKQKQAERRRTSAKKSQQQREPDGDKTLAATEAIPAGREIAKANRGNNHNPQGNTWVDPRMETDRFVPQTTKSWAQQIRTTYDDSEEQQQSSSNNKSESTGPLKPTKRGVKAESMPAVPTTSSWASRISKGFSEEQ